MTIKNYSRKDYMSGICTHKEYYGQFFSEGLCNAIVNRIGPEKILNSTNPHLNDIPLALWDKLADLVKSYTEKHFRAVNSCMSLSDCVCIAKTIAHVWKERQENHARPSESDSEPKA